MLSLKRFTSQEDGGLRDVADAEFIRERRVDADTEFNFDGVGNVTVDYLDVLFRDIPVSSLMDRLHGMNETVETSLADWLDQQTKPKRRKRAIKRHKPGQSDAKLVYEQTDESSAERYTPTRLVERLKSQLRSYIESAYPLKEPELIHARRELLDEADDKRLLAQEPYIETTPRYKFADGAYEKLGLDENVTDFLRAVVDDTGRLYPTIYQHQAEALEASMAQEKDVIVATGTGSGKTECFLIPIMGALYQEARERPASFEQRAARSLVLYPMNALVNDQIARLRMLFGDERVAKLFRDHSGQKRHPLFGMYTSRTRYPGPRKKQKDKYRLKPLLEYFRGLDEKTKKELHSKGRYPAKDLDSFYAKNRNWENKYRTAPEDRELLTRHEMVRDERGQGGSPDILVTNYSMLEYMLMRPFERPIFEETRRWLEQDGNVFRLVLDEAHLYRGARGAEIAFLVRRLLARLGINGRPEKYRVILTSASLGQSDDALERVKKFAADLVGKTPDDFIPVVGTREEPEVTSEWSQRDEFAQVLTDLDLEELHEAKSADAMRDVLAAVFSILGGPSTSKSSTEESEQQRALFEELFHRLEDHVAITTILRETAGHAISLAELSRHLFPDFEEKEAATDALLTLGALARSPSQEGEAGTPLLPTRIHSLFRGLPGLYACINQRCKGRQKSGGEHASVGKLFSRPRPHCDACGARVFELASCRDCGSTYLQAYVKDFDLEQFDYLWGEIEGELQQVTVATEEPRTDGYSEELLVHLPTGFVDHQAKYPVDEVRSLWLALEKKDGDRSPEFKRCLQCRPYTHQATNRITDFRTRGAQPFTALIETQFSEQPPQDKAEARDRAAMLPNRGRKVLIFSDGRQRAARLAPSLETTHRRDTFRQVVVLAIDELKQASITPHMSKLYPAIVKVCQKKGVALLESRRFQQHLKRANNQSLKILASQNLDPPVEYAQLLYNEFIDSFYSLTALGLGYVTEDENLGYVFDDFPNRHLSKQDVRVLYRIWLRHLFEERHFIPSGASAGYLGEEFDRPQGLSPLRPQDFLSVKLKRYLRELLEDEGWISEINDWFRNHVQEDRWFKPLNDKYYIDELSFVIEQRLEAPWWRCTTCNTLWAEHINELCPNCLGDLVDAEDDKLYLEAKAGFYRGQVQRAVAAKSLEPFGLVAAEHSAQLTGTDTDEAFEKAEKYELRFQDLLIDGKGPVDVLSCTTTMEVGIDIGSLAAVAMHNVPPHVSNYQQRAGRAGRRGTSVASVVTYAHGGTHDAHYYKHPADIISGDVRTPVVYVENPDILKRHINAFLVQRFFHATVEAKQANPQLFESLGTVESFLDPEKPGSFDKLRTWLEENQDDLLTELASWVPAYSYWQDKAVPTEELLEGAIEFLLGRLEDELPFDLWARRDELDELEKSALERQLEDHLLQKLINAAVLPRYAFPTDVVSFWVTKSPERTQDGTLIVKAEYQPQRQLPIALSEYAPGSTLTIDKYRFTSEALYSPYMASMRNVLDDSRSYVSCDTCGYISMAEGAEALAQCPTCGEQQLNTRPFVTPPGFAANINTRKQRDTGGPSRRAGRATRARIEVQDITSWDRECYDERLRTLSEQRELVVVNKGMGNRGFFICPDCGTSEPVAGKGYTRAKLFKKGKPIVHKHPIMPGQDCVGNPEGPFYMGHRFPTDVFLMRVHFQPPFKSGVADSAGRSALSSMAEALSQAATRVLQIDEGELEAQWSPVQGDEWAADIYVYDTLAGGAGYARSFGEPGNLEAIFQAAAKLLQDCSCESSCYDCLRNYGNRFFHGALDRHLAAALLGYIRNGTVPELSEEQKLKAIAPLREVLVLREFVVEPVDQVPTDSGSVTVPLAVEIDGVVTWVDVRHPLVDREHFDSSLLREAELSMRPPKVVDSYTLRHDLPKAFGDVVGD
jgi:ATP-dependent helicase YprA (DUF1998 family)